MLNNAWYVTPLGLDAITYFPRLKQRLKVQQDNKQASFLVVSRTHITEHECTEATLVDTTDDGTPRVRRELRALV